MSIASIHFLRPQWFYMLIPLVIIGFMLAKQAISESNWNKVCDSHLLPFLLNTSIQKHMQWPFLCLAFIWFVTVFTLAGPSFKQVIQPVFQIQTAKVIVLDLSTEMLAADLTPNRITRAKYKVIDLLKEFPEGQTGMVVFSQEAYTVAPLTQDTNTLISLVPELQPNIMPVPGSNISAGLLRAEQLLKQAGIHQGSLLLLTASEPNNEDFKTAQNLYAQGFKLNILGIGTARGAPIPSADGGFETNKQGVAEIHPLPENKLAKLADAGDGQYHTFSNTNEDFRYLLADSETAAAKITAKTMAGSRWRDDGRWFIWLFLPLVLLAYRRGWFEEIFK